MYPKCLNDYSQKYLELELFKKNNTKIFEEFGILEQELNELATLIKTYALEKGEMQDKITNVQVIEKWKKYFDWKKFSNVATPDEKEKLIQAGGVIQEIDKKKFEMLVKEKEISEQTAQASFNEELLTKYAIIKPLSNNEVNEN